MNAKKTGRLFHTIRPTLLLLLILSPRAAQAQGVLAPPPEVYVEPPAVQQSRTSEMEVFPPPGRVNLADEPPLRLGPVAVRPHVFYRFTRGDGIPVSGSNEVSTTIQELSPGVLFVIGDHWTLDYSPTLRFYSNDEFRDTVDQYVKLTGGTTYNGWDLGLSQSYSSSAAPLVETGAQTDQETHATAIRAAYRFNSKMSTDLGLNQTFTYTERTAREWSTLDWLNYDFWPRLQAGAGVGFGYVDVSTNDMTFEQIQGRIKWRATDKISFQVNCGVEIRQFLNSDTDQSDLINPVAGALIQYQPFDFTTLSIGLDQAVTTSVLSTNLVVETTGVSVNLNQRLLGKLNLGLACRYQMMTFIDDDDTTGDRRDDLLTFNARLACVVLKRGTVAVFYQHSKNSSNRDFDFTSNQVGFEVGYRF